MRYIHAITSRRYSKFVPSPSPQQFVQQLTSPSAQQYDVLVNPYDKANRLNLYGWDGAPMNPMYLAYKPPQMLPTQTLNPTSGAATGTASQPSSTSKSKRDLQGDDDGLVQEALKRNVMRKDSTNANQLWWLGVGMTALGSVGYFCF